MPAIEVNWNEKVCIHNGQCVRNLPAVFSVEDGKFVIREDAAAEQDIIRVVSQCPSGALTWKKR